MTNKRIFISFAIEDSTLRDFLVGQARNVNSPFEFVDMSVKQPWDSHWKTKLQARENFTKHQMAFLEWNYFFL